MLVHLHENRIEIEQSTPSIISNNSPIRAKRRTTMGQFFPAISGNPCLNDPREWTDDLSSAFTDTKQLLINATALNYPVGDAPIKLTTDASDMPIGAVLEQFCNEV